MHLSPAAMEAACSVARTTLGRPFYERRVGSIVELSERTAPAGMAW
jgi:hypothetical protein